MTFIIILSASFLFVSAIILIGAKSEGKIKQLFEKFEQLNRSDKFLNK